MSQASADDLRRFIRERWAHLGAMHPALKERTLARELDDISDEEARGFFEGLGKLFSVGGLEGVRFEYEALGGGPTKDLFEGHATKRAFRREYVLQFATASRLVMEKEWPPEQLKAEPPFEPGEWAVDIAIHEGPDRSGRWFGAVECKADMGVVRQLPHRIRQCGRSGEGDVKACTMRKRKKSDTGHQNYRALLRERPPWYCTVGPAGARTYRVEYGGPGFLDLTFAYSDLIRRP